MRRFIRRTSLTVTRNTAFEQVIRACKEIPRPGQSGTWLTEDMVEAYQLLHELGYAVSYEVWDGAKLAGGLYGLHMGHYFCGESMFTSVSNASKLAFHTLYTDLISHEGLDFIDFQVTNPILRVWGRWRSNGKPFWHFCEFFVVSYSVYEYIGSHNTMKSRSYMNRVQKRVGMLIVLLLAVAALLPAQTLSERLESYEGPFYAGELSITEIDEQAERYMAAGTAGDALIAVGLLLIAGDYEARKSTESPAALEYYRQANELIKTISLDDALYEGLLIDARLRNLIGRGAAAFITEGAAIGSLMNRAIKAYPKDARILYQYSMSKINAPRLFGGDFKKGERIAQSIIRDRKTSEVMKFKVNHAMAGVYLRKDDAKKSAAYWQAAKEIYPDTWLTLRLPDQE